MVKPMRTDVSILKVANMCILNVAIWNILIVVTLMKETEVSISHNGESSMQCNLNNCLSSQL